MRAGCEWVAEVRAHTLRRSSGRDLVKQRHDEKAVDRVWPLVRDSREPG